MRFTAVLIVRRVALASLVLALLVPGQAGASWPGNNGKIAALDSFDGYSTVYPDGSGISRLAQAGIYDCCGSWSPNGGTFMFSAPPDDESAYDSWVVDSSGTSLHKVGPFVSGATWSPDGTKVVYGGINIANANFTGPVHVPNTIAFDSGPEWSPDGTRIAFVRFNTSTSAREVYTIHPDGTGLTLLTSFMNAGVGHLDWSPDSTKLTFGWGSSGVAKVYVMNAADGTGLTPIVTGGGSPTWAPDGTKIAYAGNNNTIHLVNPDGTGDKAIIRDVLGGDLDWQSCASPCPPPPGPSYDVPQPQTAYSLDPPFQVILVPNFRQTISSTQCTARGGAPSTHGAPLSLASCNPPGYTPGTAAHMGSGNGAAFARYTPIYGTEDPGTDGASFQIYVLLPDVRTSGGADYNPTSGGDLSLITKLRITDSYNSPGSSNPATVSDFDFTTPIYCTPSPDPTIGSYCGNNTSSDAVVPGAIPESKNTVIQIFRARVNDSGADGAPGNADDRTFATQGLYIR